MSQAAGDTKREVRSFLVARDPSIDRRFRPRPERSVRLFGDIEEDEEDSTSLSSASDDISSYTMSSTSDGDGALVYLRLRPVDRPSTVYSVSGNVFITGPSNESTSTSNNKNQMEKHFSFSDIFTSEVQQRDVFEKCIGRRIEAEENFTVLTYGTSGSGKTFTLLGDEERPGIIPRSLENIFTLYASNIYPQPLLKIINTRATVIDDISCTKETFLRSQILGTCADVNAQHIIIQQCIQQEHSFQTLKLDETSVFIWVSFVEIYNEQVYDLLATPTSKSCQQLPNVGTLPSKNLKIMMNDGKVFIKGLTSVYVKNSLEALKLLRFGLQKVNYASTAINVNSSRSHCVFIVDVLKFLVSGVVTEITYKFCDLAGSERLDKTGNIGSRLKEAQRINTSLLVLGRCLDAANASTSKKNNDVIPFRESKLTMLLQSALLGKEKLAMIVNVTPIDKYYEENLNVLGFSSIAKNIIYKQPIVKQNNSRYSGFIAKCQTRSLDAELKELQEENCCLRSESERMRIIFEEEQEQREQDLRNEMRQIFEEEQEQREQDLRNEMKQFFEEEQELREQQLRNELVDSFQKDLEKRKQQYDSLLKEELENMKRTYEAKIDFIKRKYEEEEIEEIEDLNSEDDENIATKRRRTLE